MSEPSRLHVTCSAAGGKCSTPMYSNSNGKLVETPSVEAKNAAFPGGTPMPTESEIRKKGPLLFMPTVDQLTDEEFDMVPK